MRSFTILFSMIFLIVVYSIMPIYAAGIKKGVKGSIDKEIENDINTYKVRQKMINQVPINKDYQKYLNYQRYESTIFDHLPENMKDYEILKLWDKDTWMVSNGEFSFWEEQIPENKGNKNYFAYEINSSNAGNLYWISVYLSEDPDYNNYFYADITQDIVNGESKFIFSRNDFSIGNGNPSWNNLRYMRIAFQSQDSTKVLINPISIAGYNAQAMATLWFDDGWESVYTNAYPVMQAVNPNMPGEASIIGGLIGQYEYMKRNQLRDLLNSGWEISNHTYSHPDLTTLTSDQIKTEILAGANYVYDLSSTTGASNLAVPYSSINNKVLNAIRETTATARYDSDRLNNIPVDRYAIAYKEVQNTTDPAEVKQWVDQAIREGKWLVLLFHKIDYTPTDDLYTYSPAKFREIVDYLDLNKDNIRTVTVDEVFRTMGYREY